MRKFFFLSTTFFVREGDAGGAAGGATAPANGAGAASAALASKMDGGGGQQTPPAGDGGDAPWYSTFRPSSTPTIQTKGWKDAGAVVESYTIREAAREDRAGRTVTIPTDKSTPKRSPPSTRSSAFPTRPKVMKSRSPKASTRPSRR